MTGFAGQAGRARLRLAWTEKIKIKMVVFLYIEPPPYSYIMLKLFAHYNLVSSFKLVTRCEAMTLLPFCSVKLMLFAGWNKYTKKLFNLIGHFLA